MTTIALIGNPNIGKTTVFNALTGANQKVGNWPGVTVDKKEGTVRHAGADITIVDLPGAYSLGGYSDDETVARNYILQGNPDVVVDVVDATNLERNLYLTTQLLEMKAKVVIALNMMDEAQAQRLEIDIDQMERDLGVPVIPTIASKRQGLNELLEVCMRVADEPLPDRPPFFYGDLEEPIAKLAGYFHEVGTSYPSQWLAVKYVEGDSLLIEKTQNLKALKDNAEFKALVASIAKNKEAYELEIIDRRYEYIHEIVMRSVKRPENSVMSFSDKIDRFVTHPLLGIPLFAGIMFLVFQLTFAIGQDLLGGYIGEGLKTLDGVLVNWLESLAVHPFLIGFVSEGLFAGVGTVLEFIPLIAILFLLLGLLEDVGYMARAAYVMDDLMRKLGLQGKSIISMIVGFGCNVPGIMSTRTLENKNDRMIALLINPFMSCGAKIPVYAMFAQAFFPEHSGFVMFSLYALGFVVALIMAKVFSKTLFKDEQSDFIMELPPYRAPIAINVLKNMWENLASFIKRATTTIAVVVASLYLLAHLPLGVEPYGIDSVLGIIGNVIKPILAPMGNDTWQAAVGLVAGMPAKEGVVATLGMLFAGVEQGPELLGSLQRFFTPLSALSYMVMVLLYTPCVAALGAVKKETGSTKWMLFTAFFTLAIAYAVAVLVYQVGSLLGFS